MKLVKKMAQLVGLLYVIVFFSSSLDAQILDPVKWKFYTKEAKERNKVDLILEATIEDHWHLYSQDIADGGPIPTSFVFNPSSEYKAVGQTRESKSVIEFDPNFDMELKYFNGRAFFTQTIEVLTNKDFELKGELEYMVCDEKQCLPPKYVEFSFKIRGIKDVEKTLQESAVKDKPSYGSEEETAIEVEELKEELAQETLEAEMSDSISHSELPSAEGDDFVAKDVDGKKENSLWGIFLLGFGGGLIALLMPCIFPMIPLTVSFFTKQSKTKSEGVWKALIYGVSIVVIYVALGLLITLITGNSSSLNSLSTNPWFNLAFFVLFVVFAMSFFGAFEITLPSSWVNKADDASNKGGLLGIFFMAFTLSLVSFSCTGPIIGSLLVDAASKGDILGPAMGMFGFSLALAIPFALFATFPGWLNSLPKSGGWLNTVKVSLGFLELAFAFKFLSTADMTWQAGLLKRELFIAIWIGIFLLLTMYLLGSFRTPNDSPTERVSVPRLIFAIFFGSFTMYLLPGLWGAPLNIISGFPPPMFYSESPNGLAGSASPVSNGTSDAFIPEGADPEHCPLGLNCFHDFEDGLAYAKSVGKPVMLDFTGWGCVNCRKMEEQVWKDPRVLKRLREDLVIISLYVDERVKLPENEQYYSEILKSKVKTIGNKWSEFQAENYETNSQPYYVIIGHNSLEPLLPPTAYDPDIEYYINWIDTGLKRFKENSLK